MPVLFTREPLGCIIYGGDVDEAHGLKLAVMAKPCALRQRRLRLGADTALTLQQLLGGPRTVAQLAGARYGEPEHKAAKYRCDVLRDFGFAQVFGWQWQITNAGRAWLSDRLMETQ